MRLHTILTDRRSINILKELHVNEFVERKAHTLTYSGLRKRMGMNNGLMSIQNLSAAGLITQDQAEGELIISMTEKGKKFIENFDRLVSVFNDVKPKPTPFKVQYDLTDLEKKVLMDCFRLKSENGGEVQLTDLAEKVYPHKDPSKSKGALSKHLKKLEELNLLKKKTLGNRSFIDTTASGERVAQEEEIREKEGLQVEAGGAL